MALIPVGFRKYLILATVTPFVIASDQFTKAIVVGRFRLSESLPIIDGFFNLTYIRNTGAAFGFLAGADPAFRVPFFLIVPIVALVAIASIFRKIASTDYLMAVALSLVIGGAIGNLIDRVQIGYVIDFLLFHWKSEYYFPAFNVADSAICVGVGMMMLDMVLKGKEGETPSHVSGSA